MQLSSWTATTASAAQQTATATHPGLEGTPAPPPSRTVHHLSCTRLSQAHLRQRPPQLTTILIKDFCACGGRQNAVVMLCNFHVPASSMARTANYHGFSYHTVRLQDLHCGRRILDFRIADDLWVNAQHMRLPVVYFLACWLHSSCFLSCVGAGAETCLFLLAVAHKSLSLGPSPSTATNKPPVCPSVCRDRSC